VLIDFGLSRHDRCLICWMKNFVCLWAQGRISRRNKCWVCAMNRAVTYFHSGFYSTIWRLANGLSVIRPRFRFKKRLYRDPIPPRSHRPDIPAWLQEIILRCLEVEPAARFDTAHS
jgi:hypothetical protein